MSDKLIKDVIALLKANYRELVRNTGNMDDAIRSLDCYKPEPPIPITDLRKYGIEVAAISVSNGHPPEIGMRIANAGRLSGDRNLPFNAELVLTRDKAEALVSGLQHVLHETKP